jgi:transcriptional regulator with GAF, ATPase, and Fis domain
MSGVVKTLTDHSSMVGTPEPEPIALLIATGAEPLVRVIRLRDGRAVLGREIDRDVGTLELPDGRASRRHVEVRHQNGVWRVRDLGSHNGTYVDGRRIDAEVTAADGAVVRAGHSLFWLLADGVGWTDDAVTLTGGVVSGPRLRAVEEDVRGAARSLSLLVLGESGSGKERIARAYHDAGPRSSGAFVGVNCAAIPESVAERLLFGAKRGAYSGAEDAPGYVQAAHGGTLFLDELGDLVPALQAKLLRVLETREVWPVGASKGTPVELGVVAATHHDLRRAVADGRFREDLYYRMAKPAVSVPPLRERKDEIPALAAMVVATADRTLRIHPRLLEVLVTRRWPGNVRELVHEVRVAAVAARAAGVSDVRPEHLAAEAGQRLRDATPAVRADEPSASVPKTRAAAEMSREEIVAAIDAASGNLSAAARALGLHRTQLYRLMERQQIARAKGGEGDEQE